MDRRFPTMAAALFLAVAPAGCKSVPEVPPGRKMGGDRPSLPVAATQVEAPGVGFSSAPPSAGGPGFANGAPGSTAFRGSTAQTIGPNPYDLPPTGVAERAAGYQIPGLGSSLSSPPNRPPAMLSPGNR